MNNGFPVFMLWKWELDLRVSGIVVNTCSGNLCKYEGRTVQCVVKRSHWVFGCCSALSFFLPCFITVLFVLFFCWFNPRRGRFLFSFCFCSFSRFLAAFWLPLVNHSRAFNTRQNALICFELHLVILWWCIPRKEQKSTFLRLWIFWWVDDNCFSIFKIFVVFYVRENFSRIFARSGTKKTATQNFPPWFRRNHTISRC